ncbi:hypothetical protein CDAR_168431 [Caerostris darwini]|uniref:Uncharacterized protein n=1 Tax=Caerostris darwini TaxID=1538125 RepID=A0AAV4T8C6_9ARAC|nr:hypothetical protein CDAR_168431 [Caerostris darwini]
MRQLTGPHPTHPLRNQCGSQVADELEYRNDHIDATVPLVKMSSFSTDFKEQSKIQRRKGLVFFSLADFKEQSKIQRRKGCTTHKDPKLPTP